MAFRQELKCLPSDEIKQQRELKVEEQAGLFAGLLGRLTRMFSSDVTRTSPSPTDPSLLAGEPISTEDDVLHLKKCPSFDMRLSQRNSELLLSYLTVPYLRIPLIINFFASEERIKSLSSPTLRAVLDGVLFEPSHWQSSETKPLPDMVPFTDRSHLATPCGLLFNELQVSPDGILKAITSMLQLVLDMDSGRFTASVGSIVLYVVRLVVRVEGFLIYLIKHNRADKDRTAGTGWKSFARGLKCEHKRVIMFLDRVRAAIRKKLDGFVVPMLEQWIAYEVKRKKQVQLQCKFYAHLAYIYKNLEYEELNKTNASVYLCAQLFLTTRYKYESLEIKAGAEERKKHLKRSPIDRKEEESGRLGISETSMTSLFQKQRWKVLKWLENNPKQANEVFEGVVRVVTFTGTREPGPNSTLVAREWRQVTGERGIGRFYPYVKRKKMTKGEKEAARKKRLDLQARAEAGEEVDFNDLNDLGEAEEEASSSDESSDEDTNPNDTGTQPPAGDKDQVEGKVSDPTAVTPIKKKKPKKKKIKTIILKRKKHDRKESYENYLRKQQFASRSTTEVNIQLGDFTLKTLRIEVLDKKFQRIQDFQKVFGDMRGGVQCAHVKKTSKLHWCRLVGYRHDLLLWQPDTRTPDMGVFNRSYTPNLHADEMWIVHSMEPVRSKHLADYSFFLPDTRHNRSATVARLQGYKDSGGKKKTSGGVKAIKEVVVFRNPRVVHVYNVVEHGRLHYRSLVYSSDARFSLHDMKPKLTLAREWNADQYRPRYESGDARVDFKYDTSLVITRSLDSTRGVETFIPARLLYGLLPTALLEQYLFWQSELQGHLIGIYIYI